MSDSVDKYADTLKELVCFVIDVSADGRVPSELRVKGTDLVGQFLLATIQNIAARKKPTDRTEVSDLPTGRPAGGAALRQARAMQHDHERWPREGVNPAQYKHRGEE